MDNDFINKLFFESHEKYLEFVNEIFKQEPE